MNARHRLWTVALLTLSLSVVCAGCLNATALSEDVRPATVGKDIIFGPYVTAVSPNGASVHWISPPGVSGACRVAGATSVVMVQQSTSPIVGSKNVRHTALIKGLRADTLHRYEVTAGWERAEGSFRTPPPVGTREPFSFVITGDTQSYLLRIELGFDAVYREAPAFLVHTGDLCDNGKNWTLWGQQFFVPGRDVLRMAPVWPCRGNHERGVEPMASVFNLPAERLWHSFDYGNLHVVLLDQWDLENDKPMESERMDAMAAWLDADLAAAKAKADWIIVAGHQQMFNVSGHGSTWGHEKILPLLYKHGVDLVVSGHSHLYERFIPIGPSGARPIQFIVAGGGGAHNYPSMPSPILVKSFAAPHYCLYRVDGERLDLTVKGPDGSIVDHFVMSKENGQIPPAVTAAAIPPEDAKRLLKLYKGLEVDVADLPAAANAPLAATISPRRFPAESKVRITSDPGCPWTLDAVSFEAPEPLAEGETDTVPPAPLKVVPPTGVLLDEGGLFSPRLTATVELEYQGRRYVTPGVPLGVNNESLRRFVRAAAPTEVPAAPEAITLDGDLAEWANVPPPVTPSLGKASPHFKIAWRTDGLYGAVTMEQGEIHTSKNLPWNADSLEVNVEGDAYGRTWPGSLGAALRYFLSPNVPDDEGASGGTAAVKRSYGKWTQGAITGVWRRTPSGYTMEFRISDRALTVVGRGQAADDDTPAKPLEAGRVIGFDMVLRHDGQVVEQFLDMAPYRATGAFPMYWGRIQLAP